MDLGFELKIIVRRVRPGIVGSTRDPRQNLRLILDEWNRKPRFLEQLRTQFEELLATRDFIPALTEAGLSQQSNVFHEVFKRLEYKLLPQYLEPRNILLLIQELFSGSGDADWLRELEEPLLREFFARLLPQREKVATLLLPQLLESLQILSLKLAATGLDPLIKPRLQAHVDLQNAFVEGPRAVQNFIDGRGGADLVSRQLDLCERAARLIRAQREREGISLGLTFRLMRIQELTRRARLCLAIVNSLREGRSTPEAAELFREIVLAQIENFNLRQYFGRNVGMLAYQITEHTSRSGEHYVTSTRAEYFGMFRSALIGGVVVGFLAFLKVLASYLHLAPVFAALVFGLIYAVGFVVVHSLGGTLATKQPAMTAAFLAQALDHAKSSKDALENLCDVIVRVIRSQLIALLGNFIVAFPVAAGLAYLTVWGGRPLMNEEKAAAVLSSIHPWESLSFLYAALAGVCLFASGLIAGFFANWFHFNKIAARLQQSPLFAWAFRGGNLETLIPSIERNIGFWSGNIALGFFLGTMPELGVISGLPLDVRHVTFVSASFGAASSCLLFQIPLDLMVTIGVGALIMGLINLGVSFSLSLFVAIQSRGIRFAQTRQLLLLLGRRFITRPWEFIFPPANSAPAGAHETTGPHV